MCMSLVESQAKFPMSSTPHTPTLIIIRAAMRGAFAYAAFLCIILGVSNAATNQNEAQTVVDAALTLTKQYCDGTACTIPQALWNTMAGVPSTLNSETVGHPPHDDDEEEGDAGTLRTGKIITMVAVFFLTLGCSYVPWLIRRFQMALRIMSVACCFAAGVILGAGLTHILPDAAETWEEYEHAVGGHYEYPWIYLLCLFTLLLLIAIDTILVRGRMENSGHSHGDNEAAGHGHMVPSLPAGYDDSVNYDPQPNYGSGNGKAHGHGQGQAASGSEGSALIDRRGDPQQRMQAYIFFVALSIHSLFDGLSLGAEHHMNGFYALLIAIIGHKALDGFALGVPLYFADFSRGWTLASLVFCALMTPLGIGIGMAATETLEGEKGLLSHALILAMSAGSFIFISVVELLPAGLQDNKNLTLKMAVTFLGAGIMALLAIWA